MPRFLLTATAKDSQQMEFKFITSIRLGSRGLIESLEIFDITLTFQNAQRICTLLSNRLCNLKKLEFNIYDAFYPWKWNPSCIVDGKNKSTRRIVTLIYLLVDKLQKLVSLCIVFSNFKFDDTPCFPHLIRRQLHQYPLNRPFRLQFSSDVIALWLK
ncbi:unnamed protein product [Adineta steineri]|uniref:Uncharacterized protein n=1 Tax=Adineta steineri TaxID=433720 RepID=A0A819HTB4_9BILA|nr:unnamed protein product [Adineta steineri]CAF3902324.1 unnamed protein product [Adineta steineri]